MASIKRTAGRKKSGQIVFWLYWGHSSVHWRRNCSADHTATQTIGPQHHWHYSCSVIRDTQRPWSFVSRLASRWNSWWMMMMMMMYTGHSGLPYCGAWDPRIESFHGWFVCVYQTRAQRLLRWLCKVAYATFYWWILNITNIYPILHSFSQIFDSERGIPIFNAISQ